MLNRGTLQAATLQLDRGRGIVRCQTLIPSETGRQTHRDVTCTWSVLVRQGGAALPGQPAVRPTPNWELLSLGHPISASTLCSC